jgi:hypothetical protein
LTITPGGPSLTPTQTLTPSITPTGTPPNYTSNPLPGGTIVVNTFVGATANGQLFVQNTGGGTLNVQAQLPSGLSSRVFLTSSVLALSGGQSGTIDFQCVTSAAGTTSANLQVTNNDPDLSTALNYTVICNVASVTATPTPSLTPVAAAQTSTAAAQGTGTSSNVQQCSEGQVLSSPLPSDATGEYLLVNCFLVTGPGAINITLTQVLTNPFAGVDASDLTIINANPGLMTVWRMGSWFLIPSTYNAATTTYQFESISGTQVYAFFYGAITVPVNSQGSVTTTSGAGIITGNVEDEIADIPVKEDKGVDPRAILISTVITILLAVGFFTTMDRRKKRRQI